MRRRGSTNSISLVDLEWGMFQTMKSGLGLSSAEDTFRSPIDGLSFLVGDERLAGQRPNAVALQDLTTAALVLLLQFRN